MFLHARAWCRGGHSDENAAAHLRTVATTSTESGAGVARRRYQLHGLEIHVLADDPRVLGPVHAMLKHLGLLPGVVSENPVPIVLCFSARPGAIRLPPGARVVAEQGGIRAWSMVGALYLTCPGHVCRLDTAARVGAWRVPPPSALVRKDIVTYGLLLLLRRRGLYALHASAVARGGAGLLFAAPSGSGKSTLTYSLVRQGWEYLGDDAILLRAHDEEIEALALRRDLCLAPALVHTFPEISEHGESGPFAGQGKRLLPMCSLYPGRLIDRCVPRTLVFPEIVSRRTSRLVPLDQAEAFMRLARQSAVVALDPAAVPAHLQALGRLTRQASSYRLLAGRDLNGHPEAVAALLADVHAPLARARAE